MIQTLDYGYVPIAVDTTYVHDECIDLIEMCDGSYYEIKRAFSGSIVAVLSK